MRSTTRRAAVSAALVLSGALLLTACGGNGSGTGGSSGSTGAGSGASSSPTAASGGQSSGGQSSGGDASTGGTGGTSASGAEQADGCQNLVATAAVKAAVTKAYEAQSGRGHITPRPHQFLYGQCHGTTYAATAFDVTAGASLNDQVAGQDDGSTRRYFSLGADGTWTVLGAAGFPDMGGCVKIPSELAKLWNNCPSGNQ